MAMDLSGINNCNEYYTNHYFTSLFEGNAADTISVWKQLAKDNEEQAPWQKLRDIGKKYHQARDRFLNARDSRESELVPDLAEEYLKALGYGRPEPENIEVADDVIVPVYKEVKKANGAPYLWVLVSKKNDDDDSVLQSTCFDSLDEDNGDTTALINDELLSKIYFAGEEAPRWVLLIGIDQIALIDRNKWNEKRYMTFELNTIYQRHEETTFQAMSVLLHKKSLCPEEGTCLLDILDENSHKNSASVSDALKYALRECIELLGNEVIYDMRTRQGIYLDENSVDASVLTAECLRYMYRMLFMLFIEARYEQLGFSAMKAQSYVHGYSLEGLRDIAENVRDDSDEIGEGYYLGDTLGRLYEMVYTGYPEAAEVLKALQENESTKDIFVIEPMKAHIFDPQYTQLISKAKLRNKVILQIIDLMSISRPGNRRERVGRISYSALGINQMGAVYEALLSYRGFFAEEKLFEVKRARDDFNELDVGYFVPENQLDNYSEDERVRYSKDDPQGRYRKGDLRSYEKGTFIYRLAGREREKSASYYTPEVLTKCLVKYALKELLKDKSADDILNLTICEPAMGSAAFLNEAINQIAEAYISKKQEELGEIIAFDERFEKLQQVKMYIADSNVYGVDLNPIAVELAEVSLWLNTIYKGAYVPWFGTQIVCGNSLIGARRQVYYTSKLEKGKWYEEAPIRLVPGEKRRRAGVSNRVYHFLLGDTGMSDYQDSVIKKLEPDNLKKIKEWNKKFTEKYSEDEIDTLQRLSDTIDQLWDEVVTIRKKVKEATDDLVSVYGHSEPEKQRITIHEKDDIYHRLYKSERMNNAGPYARLKAVMDYWCALWFWPIEKAELLPSKQEFLLDLSLLLEGTVDTAVTSSHAGQMEMAFNTSGVVYFEVEGTQLELETMKLYEGHGIVDLSFLRDIEKNPDRYRAERFMCANDIAEKQKFLHWELEFADVFAENGGFDLIIGNPPWIKIEWNEQSVLSDSRPSFVIKNYSAARVAEERKITLEDKEIYDNYLDNYVQFASMQDFLNAQQNYSVLKGTQANLYKCFLPQAWSIGSKTGVSAFVHPEGVYDDPKGKDLRKNIYERLVYHFHFINERLLFRDIGHPNVFGISIYNNSPKLIIGFDSISNLFVPETIDECYESDGSGVAGGLKDDNDEWNTNGHKDRIVKYDVEKLRVLAKLEGSAYDETKLLVLQTNTMLDIIDCFAKVKRHISDITVISSEMWHETNAQELGIIRRRTKFPENRIELICSGPHIGVANPYFKTPRHICEEKADYDVIHLECIDDDYSPRTNYVPNIDMDQYFSLAPDGIEDIKYIDSYRLLSRKMLNLKQERTLNAAVVAPSVGHVHGVVGFQFSSMKDLVLTAGMWASLPVDFYVKVLGKSNMSLESMKSIPIVNDDFSNAIIYRSLLLNCMTKAYSNLYENIWEEEFENESWAKEDSRLNRICRKREWTGDVPLRNYYERREALVEIDVLVAMMIGITLGDLKSIYRIQFPVLQSYEADTWYDQNGRIVFTNNRSLTGVGFARPEWERIKDAREGTFPYTFEDDTMPEGLVTRTIEYVAPFDRCDREKDYEEVWNNFEQRFGK